MKVIIIIIIIRISLEIRLIGITVNKIRSEFEGLIGRNLFSNDN